MTRFFSVSPRYLPTHFTKLLASKDTGLKESWKIKMKISKLSKANYDPLVDVIPQNALVGMADKIPGLESSILEIPQDPLLEIVHTFNDRETLYLHGLTITGVKGWEKHLTSYVSSFANAKYGDDI